MALRFPAGGALGPEILQPGPGLATHYVPLSLFAVATFHHVSSLWLTTGVPSSIEQVSLNLSLTAVLCVAIMAWALLRARCRVDASSGAGLVLASYGLAALAWIEMARAWIDMGSFYGAPAIERGQGGPLLEFAITGGRGLALAAFAFGLASAVAAVVSHGRRVARAGRPT